jgi:hypothetical protein
LNVATDNQTNLNVPGAGANAPGESYNLRLTAADTLTTPALPGAALSEGWVHGRWNGNSQVLSNSAAVRILDVMNGTTVVVTLRSSANTSPATLSLYVNGTLVGTSSGAYGDSTVVVAVGFDLTQPPPEATLVVDGVTEVALGAGSGVPTTVDRVRLGGGGSGGASNFYWGAVSVWDALADWADLTTIQDVWATVLAPDLVTDADNSFTPSDTTDLGDISDADDATYISTSTDPDSVVVGFQSTTDKLAAWGPTVIYGMAAVAYGTADVITSTTIEISDSGGAIDSEAVTMNAVGKFAGVWVTASSLAAPLTAFDINSATATYTVT